MPGKAPGMVLKLIKALYGLKQFPREWNINLDNYLCRDLKMNYLTIEQFRFTEDQSQYLILGGYADDLIITVSTQATMTTLRVSFFFVFSGLYSQHGDHKECGR